MKQRTRPVFYVAYTHDLTPGTGRTRDRRHATAEGSPYKGACGSHLSTRPELTRWQDRAVHEEPDCLDCHQLMARLLTA